MGIVFEDALPGIVVAMLFVATPFYVNSVREGFQKVPVHLENVARTLGATRFRAFILIVIPSSVRQILNGCILDMGARHQRVCCSDHDCRSSDGYLHTDRLQIHHGGLAREAVRSHSLMIAACFLVFIVLRTITRYLGRYDDRV